jgi:hypothetical protein
MWCLLRGTTDAHIIISCLVTFSNTNCLGGWGVCNFGDPSKIVNKQRHCNKIKEFEGMTSFINILAIAWFASS